MLQDFWQATFDLQSHLAKVEEHQQFDVRVSVETLKNLLDGVEAIGKVRSIQEKHSVTQPYVGTLLGALIGIIGNFFVTLCFQPQTIQISLGLAVSFGLLALVCAALFLQSKKYAQD